MVPSWLGHHDHTVQNAEFKGIIRHERGTMLVAPIRFPAHQQRTYVKNRGATVENPLNSSTDEIALARPALDSLDTNVSSRRRSGNTMKTSLDRRRFLATTAAASAVLSVTPAVPAKTTSRWSWAASPSAASRFRRGRSSTTGRRTCSTCCAAAAGIGAAGTGSRRSRPPTPSSPAPGLPGHRQRHQRAADVARRTGCRAGRRGDRCRRIPSSPQSTPS